MTPGLLWIYYQENVFTITVYLIYMYEEDLVFNNL